MRKRALLFALIIPVLCLLTVGIYYIPPVHERLVWRVDSVRAKIKYAINPPEKVVFVPQATAGALVTVTPLSAAAEPSVTPSPSPVPTETRPGPTDTPAPTPTATETPPPTATFTPPPPSVRLTGITHEYQRYNNCGPANLSMALSYWGWTGDQYITAAFLKPNQQDRNVLPAEMKRFVDEQTGLRALVRVGGNLDLLKTLVAAGFPVIIEKGFEGERFDGWMGHYEVVNGYDDARQRLTVQDSYVGANQPVTYADVESQWRAFNHTYLVIYPPEREAEVLAILGPFGDEQVAFTAARERAQAESETLRGRDRYFALYNLGTNDLLLGDYAAAAAAYDAAFAHYPSIPLGTRPARMLWYQTGPYEAYFQLQRYQDIVNLATLTLDAMVDPVLEESYYWRGRAWAALGDRDAAIADFRRSVEVHPGYAPGLEQLQLLGVEP